MRKVIIDCDPGIDDTLALSLAVKSPDIEVVAITVVCGNVPADIGTQNVLKCPERCDRLDILSSNLSSVHKTLMVWMV